VRTITHSRWHWWHFAIAIALGVLAVVINLQPWRDIYTIAMNDEEQSHIFLAPVVALWMALARRIRLRNCFPEGTIFGPAIAIIGAVMGTLGYESNVQSFWHAGAIVLLIGAVITALGKNVLFRFLPAFAVLAFLVPVPGTIRQAISVPLQTASAACTQVLLEAVGVEVVRSGNLLTINDVPVAVAEACNGMRMVFALVLVSYAFAFSLPLRNSVRFLVLLFSPAAALVCNVLRLLPTTLVYGYSTRQNGETFHDVSGWLMLPIAFLLLMGVIRVLQWALVPIMRYNLAYQ
jgi:exosortase